MHCSHSAAGVYCHSKPTRHLLARHLLAGTVDGSHANVYRIIISAGVTERVRRVRIGRASHGYIRGLVYVGEWVAFIVGRAVHQLCIQNFTVTSRSVLMLVLKRWSVLGCDDVVNCWRCMLLLASRVFVLSWKRTRVCSCASRFYRRIRRA